MNRLQTRLVLFIEIYIQKRHFPLIKSEKPTRVTNLTRVLTKNVLSKLRCLQTFFQSLLQLDSFKKVTSQELVIHKLQTFC